jgi:hypothetical protein
MRPSKDTQFNNKDGQSILDTIKEKIESSDNKFVQKIFSLFKSTKDDIKETVKGAVVSLEVSSLSNKEIIANMTNEQILNHLPNNLGPNFMTTPIYSPFDQMIVDKQKILKGEGKEIDKLWNGMDNALKIPAQKNQRVHLKM